jgi:tryptophan-rich sensory protein
VSQPQRWIGLVVFIGVCLGAAGLGALATAPEIDGWYRELTKPSWNPPAWVFGPVWTTLYVMMATAAWLVWQQRGLAAAAGPLALFCVQLALNIAWSWIFFGMHQVGWAFVDLVLLWLAIAATMVAFFKRSTYAGLLLVPYLAWVSFAGALNFAIWRLNAS